jgi:hypothetical protein
LLVKLNCNIDQIHGLNGVLANKVKNFKIHYRVIHFYDQFVCNWKWNTPMKICQQPQLQKKTASIQIRNWMKNHIYTTFRTIFNHPIANFWRRRRFWVKVSTPKCNSDLSQIAIKAIVKPISEPKLERTCVQFQHKFSKVTNDN